MNTTIDDFYGDSVTKVKPLYSEGWAYGPNCSTCTVKPDVDSLFDHSWHEITAFANDPYSENVTISFNGTAIWVYFVIPNFTNHSTGAVDLVNVTFELDHKMHGFYAHEPDGTNTSFYYNVTVYSNTSLGTGEHTLVMTPQAANGATYLGFDWAQYTPDDIPTNQTSTLPSGISKVAPSATSSAPTILQTDSRTRTSVGAIAGGVIGGIIGVMTIILLVLFLLRRRVRKRKGPEAIADPEHEVIEEVKSVISPFPLTSLSQAGDVNNDVHVLYGPQSPDSAYEHAIHLRAISSPETDSLSPSAMSSSTMPLTLHSPKASDGSSAALRSPSTMPPSPPANSDQASRMSPLGSDSAISQLSRQIRDIEQTVSELRRRQSTDHRATASLVASTQQVPLGASPRNDVELRLEIAALQMEVERLRMEQAMFAPEAPPAYESRDREEVEVAAQQPHIGE